MKPGRGSQTAVLVCIGRAVGDGTSTVARYSDPTALQLLPERARARVMEARASHTPPDLRARVRLGYLRRQSKMMVTRTIAIDDAIRETTAPQLVILGAGLDGRAWRMPELRDAVVFEVDHPDTQRDKRARLGGLTQTAREVRFVAVDFARDSLEDALAAAGHDATRPTTWVWEGVVMYLEKKDVAATLAVLARRSTVGSRLIVNYHRPALLLWLLSPAVRYLGEPFRSTYTADEMRALLTDYRFSVVRDDGLPELGAALTPDVALATRRLKHLRIVVADRI